MALDDFEYFLRLGWARPQNARTADRQRKIKRIAQAVGEEQFRRGEHDVVLANAQHASAIEFRRLDQVAVQVASRRGPQPAWRQVPTA